MKIKKLFISAALMGSLMPLYASDTTLSFDGGNLVGYFDLTPFAEGGQDTITFEGLAAGNYEVELNFGGLNINVTSITLNGEPATFSSGAPGFPAFSFVRTAFSPFVLDIVGSVANSARPAFYGGSISAVAAVPEPETYALALTGLGLGLLFRRQSKKSDTSTPVPAFA